MKYLSLFSGIGGFELGITQAYDNRPNLRNRASSLQQDFPNAESEQERPTCVGFSEVNKYAIQVYQSHFPTHHNYGDITKINADELPDFDLLVGGFPCQSFSIAGLRRGFLDTRGTLFFDIARILKVKRPSLLLLENVKGLLSHDEGKTFSTIVWTLDELGYDLQWQVLNSKNHGVPQNRERVFIIGHLRGTSRPEVFPFGDTNEEDIRNVGEDIAYTIDANYAKGTNTLEKGRRSVLKVDRPEWIESDTDDTDGRGTYPKVRRLTPTECARLQGFPDDWCSILSDSQAYKCYGNAVTVNVIKDIMTRLLTFSL